MQRRDLDLDGNDSERQKARQMAVADNRSQAVSYVEDIEMLLKVLHRLRNDGNTVVVIEHNLDVIKTADWLIDLGPEGGDGGGVIIATGTPEDVAANTLSHTGHYLGKILSLQAEQQSALTKSGKKTNT